MSAAVQQHCLTNNVTVVIHSFTIHMMAGWAAMHIHCRIVLCILAEGAHCTGYIKTGTKGRMGDGWRVSVRYMQVLRDMQNVNII